MTIFSDHVSLRTTRLYISGIISDNFINDLSQCLIDPLCNNFIELNFRNTNLSSIQAEILFKALRNNTDLARLDLSSNSINTGLEKLSNILPTTNIKELILTETGISDKDLTKKFFVAIRKSNLEYLDLSYNLFGEEGAICMIRELFNSTTINKVELKGNRGITPHIALKLGDIIDNECKKYSFEICLLKKKIWLTEHNKNYYSGYIDTSFWIDPDNTTSLPALSDIDLSTTKYNQSNTLDTIFHQSNISNITETDNYSSQNNDHSYLSWVVPTITLIAGCAIGVFGKITYDHCNPYNHV